MMGSSQRFAAQRRLSVAVVALLAIVLVMAAGGCAAAAPACTVSQLSVRFAGVEGALGTELFQFDLTNTSSAPCSLNGYLRAEFLSPYGDPAPLTYAADEYDRPSAVGLLPGQVAHGFFATGGGQAGTETCRYSNIVSLITPGSDTPVKVVATSGPFSACGNGNVNVEFHPVKSGPSFPSPRSNGR